MDDSRLSRMFRKNDIPSATKLKSSRQEDLNESKKLTDQLLKELECPVCMESMAPPIEMCVSGHNICSYCKPQLRKCPSCRKAFIGTRNMTLENMARMVIRKCPFSEYGCKYSYPADMSNMHEEGCPYRPYKCPLSNAEGINCDWFDVYAQLRNHIESKHTEFQTKMKGEKTVKMTEIDLTKRYSNIYFASEEIFYQELEVIDDMFHFVVKYVGPENHEPQYRYSFFMSTPKKLEMIHINFIARSYLVDTDEIYESGHCVILDVNTVKHFLQDDKNLVYTISIAKVN